MTTSLVSLTLSASFTVCLIIEITGDISTTLNSNSKTNRHEITGDISTTLNSNSKTNRHWDSMFQFFQTKPTPSTESLSHRKVEFVLGLSNQDTLTQSIESYQSHPGKWGPFITPLPMNFSSKFAALPKRLQRLKSFIDMSARANGFSRARNGHVERLRAHPVISNEEHVQGCVQAMCCKRKDKISKRGCAFLCLCSCQVQDGSVLGNTSTIFNVFKVHSTEDSRLLKAELDKLGQSWCFLGHKKTARSTLFQGQCVRLCVGHQGRQRHKRETRFIASHPIADDLFSDRQGRERDVNQGMLLKQDGVDIVKRQSIRNATTERRKQIEQILRYIQLIKDFKRFRNERILKSGPKAQVLSSFFKDNQSDKGDDLKRKSRFRQKPTIDIPSAIHFLLESSKTLKTNSFGKSLREDEIASEENDLESQTLKTKSRENVREAYPTPMSDYVIALAIGRSLDSYNINEHLPEGETNRGQDRSSLSKQSPLPPYFSLRSFNASRPPPDKRTVQEGQIHLSSQQRCQHRVEPRLVVLPGCIPKTIITTSCQGSCHSRSVPQWSVQDEAVNYIAHCNCCASNSIKFRNIVFRCPRRRPRVLVKRLGFPFQCSCRPCSIVPEVRAEQPYDY